MVRLNDSGDNTLSGLTLFMLSFGFTDFFASDEVTLNDGHFAQSAPRSPLEC